MCVLEGVAHAVCDALDGFDSRPVDKRVYASASANAAAFWLDWLMEDCAAMARRYDAQRAAGKHDAPATLVLP